MSKIEFEQNWRYGYVLYIMIRKFWGYPNILILNPQIRYFHQNVNFHFSKNVVFFDFWRRKLSFREIGVMDMANMLDSVLNRLYTTFPNIFSLISAISADLSKSQKNHILKKNVDFFDRKSALERLKRVQ